MNDQDRNHKLQQLFSQTMTLTLGGQFAQE